MQVFFDALEGLNWQLMVGSASLTILIAHFLDGNSQYLQHQLGHLNAAGNCHLHAVHHLVALKQRVMFDLKEKLWSNYIPKLTRMLTYNLNKLQQIILSDFYVLKFKLNYSDQRALTDDKDKDGSPFLFIMARRHFMKCHTLYMSVVYEKFTDG